MIKNLQALRGVAAGIVFFVHLLSTKQNFAVNWGVVWLHDHFYLVGPAGVDIFFVISGFIVTTTAVKAAAEGRLGAYHFALRRIFRLYPIYWCVLVFAVPCSTFLVLSPPEMARAPVWRILLALTTDNRKVMLAWTLYFEVFFYAVLTVLIAVSGKHLFKAILVWLGLEIALLVLSKTVYPELAGQVYGSFLILEFAAGCMVAFVVERRWLLGGYVPLVAGVVAFVVGVRVQPHFVLWDPMWRTICFGPASALIVYGLVVLERKHQKVLPKWLQRLGDASYSLYIWHQLVFAALLYACERLHLIGKVPDIVLFVSWGALALWWGSLSYRFFEAPVLRTLNARFLPPRRATPAPEFALPAVSSPAEAT